MNGRVASAIALTESTMYEAYREWLRHAESCDGCRAAEKPSAGCDKGKDLWGAYRLARIQTPRGTGGGA